MSKKNSLQNKAIRRAERQETADRQRLKREVQKLYETTLTPEPPKVSDLVVAETVLWTPDKEK